MAAVDDRRLQHVVRHRSECLKRGLRHTGLSLRFFIAVKFGLRGAKSR
jgi:hypothetical protein